jgi:hypothetical protein
MPANVPADFETIQMTVIDIDTGEEKVENCYVVPSFDNFEDFDAWLTAAAAAAENAE